MMMRVETKILVSAHHVRVYRVLILSEKVMFVSMNTSPVAGDARRSRCQGKESQEINRSWFLFLLSVLSERLVFDKVSFRETKTLRYYILVGIEVWGNISISS